MATSLSSETLAASSSRRRRAARLPSSSSRRKPVRPSLPPSPPSCAHSPPPAVILQNHGLLTVGTTIDSAVAWFIMLEKQCEVQLLADAAGQAIPIDEPQAAFTFKELGHEPAGYFQASPYFQVIEYLQGEEYRK